MVKRLKIMNKTLVFKMIFSVLVCSCNYEPNYMKYYVRDLSKTLNDTLEVNTIERVNNVEILIKGTVNGNAILKFENGSGTYNKVELEGLVNEIYKTEWYDNKLHFIYQPISEIKGDSLVLEYRIY